MCRRAAYADWLRSLEAGLSRLPLEIPPETAGPVAFGERPTRRWGGPPSAARFVQRAVVASGDVLRVLDEGFAVPRTTREDARPTLPR